MEMFPGKEVISSFGDGIVGSYTPSLPEIVLGIGGVAIALAATFVGVRVLRFLPDSLSDEAVDPHYSVKEAEASA
jgi:molybdopterin-containing oxidoreductase family membrane subunit